MFLKSETIGLRALEPSDADLLYNWENNMGLWPVSYTQLPLSRFILDEFVNTAYQDIYTSKQLRLMVVNLADNKTIGIVDLFEFEPQHGRCGAGIYIHEEFRGRGHALESIVLVKQYCFNTLHLKQLYVHVGDANKASWSLFEKAGFEKAGLKKCWNKTGLSTYEDVWFLQCINPA